MKKLIQRGCVDLLQFYGGMFKGRNWQLSSKRYILIHSFHLMAFAVLMEIFKVGTIRVEIYYVLGSFVMIAGFGVLIEGWTNVIPHDNNNQSTPAAPAASEPPLIP